MPPKAWDSAVRCGTAVSGTRDSGTPTATPNTIGTMIHRCCTISTCSPSAIFIHVAITASAIAATPAFTPLRAVFGSFIENSA